MNNDGKAKQVILVRKDLKMGKGKIGAQASHASLAAFLNLGETKPKELSESLTLSLSEADREWLINRFTKICLRVDSEEELLSYYEKAKKAGLKCSLIKDAGFTELEGSNYTTVGIGPDFNEKINEITKDLKLLY